MGEGAIWGQGKLFGDEGAEYICDTRYNIKIFETIEKPDPRPRKWGTLHDIEYTTLIKLNGGHFILELQYGGRVPVNVTRLAGQPQDHAVIYVGARTEE